MHPEYTAPCLCCHCEFVPKRPEQRFCSMSCASKLRPRRHTPSPAERLNARVDKSGDCYLWTGARSAAGYGQMRAEGHLLYTHRLAYEIAYGPIPDGMEVCHRCDTPACCRPDHLFLGTHQQNVTDMITKGRKGKLTPDDVREVRRAHAAGEATGSALARRFGVTSTAIRQIVLGKHWPHLL